MHLRQTVSAPGPAVRCAQQCLVRPRAFFQPEARSRQQISGSPLLEHRWQRRRLCWNHAHAEIVDRDFTRPMAASILPKRIHPSGRRWPFDETSWGNDRALEKLGREGTVSAGDTRSAGDIKPVLEETGGREMMMHTLDPQLLERPIRILVVGCGGNGSAIVSGLPYLHQAMLAFGHPGGLQVTLIDPDTVSETNCVRQPFCRTEIGFPKAIVLAHRINLFWGLNWQGMQAQIQHIANNAEVDLVIGCVDTRKARRAIDKWALQSRALYWLDLGNNASSGQFILGQPKNRVNQKKKYRLPSVTELFPEIAALGVKDDGQPSCSAAEALTRQEPFINQNLAYQALGMLTQLLRHGSVSYQGGFYNLSTGRVVPLAIRAIKVTIEPAAVFKTSLPVFQADGSRHSKVDNLVPNQIPMLGETR